MVDNTQVISETEDLQIEALERGATPEEASLQGKLPETREIPSEGTFDIAVGGEEATFQPPVDQDEGPFKALEKESPNSPFNFLADRKDIPSDDYLRSQALQLMLIKQAMNPTVDPTTLFEESLAQLTVSPDIEETRETIRQEFASQQIGESLNEIEQNIVEGNLSAEEVEVQIETSQEISDIYTGIEGQEKAFVDSYADATLEQQILDDFVVEKTAWGIYGDWLETQGGFADTMIDVAGLIFVPDFVKDINDLLGGKLFRTPENAAKFFAAYQKADPDLRTAIFKDLFPKMVEEYENNQYKMAIVIAAMHDPDFSTILQEEVAFDAVGFLDVAVAAFPIKAIRGILKSVQLNKKLKEVGALEEAAQATMAHSGNESTNLIGGSQVDAAITATPWKFEDTPLGIATADDLSPDIIKLRDQLQREVQDDIIEPLTEVRKEEEFLKIPFLEDVEKEAAIDSFKHQIEAKAASKGFLFRNAEVIESNDSGFVVKYDLFDETTDTLALRRKDIRLWQRTDSGAWQSTNPDFKGGGLSNLLGSFFISPETRLRRIDPKIVSTTTLAQQQAATIQNRLLQQAKTVSKGLSRQERISVNELIAAGDEGREVFSLRDLLDGNVELASGKKRYSHKEIGGYIKQLTYNQELHSFREWAMKKDMNFIGARELNYKFDTAEGEYKKIFGIPKDDFKGVKFRDEELVLAPGINKSGYISGREFERMSERLRGDGFKPVQIIDGFEVSGKRVGWALIKDTGDGGQTFMNKLPDRVLNYDGPWYSPRVRRPGYYYIKNAVRNTDGGDVPAGSTLRAARSLKEAEQWVIDFNRKQDIDQVPVGERINPVPFRDRELGALDILAEDANQYGGLITGARKSGGLTDVNGNALERVSYNQATQRYIESSAQILTTNRLKLSLIERWKDTVNKLAARNGNTEPAIDPLADWKTAPVKGLSAADRRAMEQARDYIKNQFNISSNEENTFNTFMMDLVEFADGRFGLNERVHDRLVSFAHTNPFKSLRAATFNLMLGWFNPRQLYMQAQNATIAIGVDPVRAPRALAEAAAMRTMMFMPNKQLDEVVHLAADAISMKKADLAENIRQFNRSGLEASILKNADYDAVRQGLTGGAMDRLRNAAQKGLIMYKEGEMFSMLTAWNIAKKRFTDKFPKRVIDDKAIAEITAEVRRIAINFTSANAAGFQRGISGNALQFAQVQAKLVERVVGSFIGKGEWTKAEASRVLGMQIAAYGVVGVPLVEEFSAYMLDQFGVTPTELKKNNPQIFELITDGANGWFASVLGFDNTFGGPTASLLAGLDNNAVAGVAKSITAIANSDYDKQDSFAEIVFGPSITTIERGVDAFGTTFNAMYDLVHVPTLQTLGDVSLEVLEDWISLTSTGNRAFQAKELFQLEAAWSKSGKKILGSEDIEQYNMLTKLAQGLGFDVDAKTAYYSLKDQRLNTAKDLAATKRNIKEMMRTLQRTGNFERYKTMLGLSLAKFEDQPILRNEVMQDVIDSVMKDKVESALDREVKGLINDLIRSGGELNIPIVSGDISEGRE